MKPKIPLEQSTSYTRLNKMNKDSLIRLVIRLRRQLDEINATNTAGDICSTSDKHN